MIFYVSYTYHKTLSMRIAYVKCKIYVSTFYVDFLKYSIDVHNFEMYIVNSCSNPEIFIFIS